MPDISGLAGVMVFTSVERFEVMRRFYVEQVGLAPDPASPAEGRVAFSWGEPPRRLRLILATHDGVHGANADPYRVMLNLLVHDARATADRLRAAGLNIEEPREQSWGGWIATFHDPDGNTLQLLQLATPVGL